MTHKVVSTLLKFKYKSASAFMEVKNGNGFVYSGIAKKRKKGHGAKLLKEICDYADEHNLTLTLKADGYTKDTFKSNRELADFYARFGFKDHDNQPVNMYRK